MSYRAILHLSCLFSHSVKGVLVAALIYECAEQAILILQQFAWFVELGL